MRSATRAGFRIAGLMAMTFLIAHCGDSSTHIRTGGGVNPSAGTFEGTLDRDGSTITVPYTLTTAGYLESARCSVRSSARIRPSVSNPTS